MLYPFMTLNDNTEIVHSEILENSGKEEVEVRIEKPVQGGFYSATCWLPEYRWENIQGILSGRYPLFSGASGIRRPHHFAAGKRRWNRRRS